MPNRSTQKPDTTARRRKPSGIAATFRLYGPLAPRRVFLLRLAFNLSLALAVVAVSLTIGTFGYHSLGGLDWIDAFLDAAMILSGMGQVVPVDGDAAKLFAGVYALFSGLALAVIAGLIIAPILHRFLHRFHLADEEDER